MPPEQFGGRAVPASDLYGLGATLIYLVTGRDPADLPQIDLRIQFEQAANLSPALTSWLKWMTQPSLDKRLSSAQQARQALEKPQSILKDTASTIYVNAARPESTKIFLHKDANYLKISIPAMELQYGKANFWLSLIAFVIGLPFFLMGLLAILIPVLFLLVSLLTLNIGGLIGSLIFSFLFTPIVGFFFGILGFIAIYPLLDQLYHGTRSTRISIDKQEISLTYKFWIFRVTRTVKRQDIIELLVRAMSNPSAWKKRDIYTWFTSNTITLQGRKERFHIRKYPGLTEAELYWLADELSTWLNVPLTKACFQTITTTK
jgi:serine/threonine protein kinase